MSVIIVTATDEAYAPLARDLIASLKAAGPQDFRIGCLDLGLAPDTRDELFGQIDEMVTPDWPFRPHPVFDAQPKYLSRAVRPFLPRYFPNHHAYIWIDADAWVQNLEAIRVLGQAIPEGMMAVVPAVDRAYFHSAEDRAWTLKRYNMALDDADAARLAEFSYINAGVFALGKAAPHWRAWEQRFQAALDRWEGDFLSDQAILNALIYLDRLPAMLLPSDYNWICHLARPVWAPRLRSFISPNFPWQRLGIIHNTLNDKHRKFAIALRNGGALESELTYSAYRALAVGAVA